MEPNRKGCGYACGVILLRAHACWKIGRNTVLVSDIASLNLNTRLAPSIWHIAARPDSVAPAFQISLAAVDLNCWTVESL
jgi:hypothetical protein